MISIIHTPAISSLQLKRFKSFKRKEDYTFIVRVMLSRYYLYILMVRWHCILRKPRWLFLLVTVLKGHSAYEYNSKHSRILFLQEKDRSWLYLATFMYLLSVISASKSIVDWTLWILAPSWSTTFPSLSEQRIRTDSWR